MSVEISKLHYQNNELTIILITGQMITLKVAFQDIKSTKPQEPTRKVCELRLIECLTPQFDHFLDRYDSLFDEEYLPDNIADQILWKPLPAKPLYLSQSVKFKSQF